jgi:hypothetical protein
MTEHLFGRKKTSNMLKLTKKSTLAELPYEWHVKMKAIFNAIWE